VTAAALATSESVLRVPLARLHPSPTNPRKHLGDLTELAASIAQVGVLEPLVARPKGDDFEIDFAELERHAAEAEKEKKAAKTAKPKKGAHPAKKSSPSDDKPAQKAKAKAAKKAKAK
jgi:hypothetical protein